MPRRPHRPPRHDRRHGRAALLDRDELGQSLQRLHAVLPGLVESSAATGRVGSAAAVDADRRFARQDADSQPARRRQPLARAAAGRRDPRPAEALCLAALRHRRLRRRSRHPRGGRDVAPVAVHPLRLPLAARSRTVEPERLPAAASFVRQLAWRDFFHQLLAARPETAHEDMRPRGDRWSGDRDALEAWKNGQTGYPIVDAGMRQLLREGYMHNRARLITASFLVRDLARRLARRSATLLRLARRRRRRQQRRQLAVGRRHRSEPASQPRVQPAQAGTSLRPRRRLRPPLRQ